jgi:hypothetical protein
MTTVGFGPYHTSCLWLLKMNKQLHMQCDVSHAFRQCLPVCLEWWVATGAPGTPRQTHCLHVPVMACYVHLKGIEHQYCSHAMSQCDSGLCCFTYTKPYVTPSSAVGYYTQTVELDTQPKPASQFLVPSQAGSLSLPMTATLRMTFLAFFRLLFNKLSLRWPSMLLRLQPECSVRHLQTPAQQVQYHDLCC